jgi:hypothetical protein
MKVKVKIEPHSRVQLISGLFSCSRDPKDKDMK